MSTQNKTFECGTLVPGCSWHTTAESDGEIVRRAIDHMKIAHNETVIRPSMVEAIKQRITGEKPEAA